MEKDRMSAFELNEKISEMGINCEKARTILWYVVEEYFGEQTPDPIALEYNYQSNATLLQILDDYLLRIERIAASASEVAHG